ncbi:hypothetical protein GYMLUDRAFT_56824 [Collybiopsis luxurians FD-317 M1]|nr:hypothetical protein GYMLUDRAFT_56824 [Collybiopsis luxurians FD-317 M1]
MWRNTALPELFCWRKLGSKKQVKRLLEVTEVAGGKYKRDWKCLIFNGCRLSWQKKPKKEERKDWNEGRNYEWYNDEEMRKLLLALDLTGVKEVCIYGCRSDGEINMPDGAVKLFLELLKCMPNLKDINLTHNDFTALSQAKSSSPYPRALSSDQQFLWTGGDMISHTRMVSFLH